MNFWPAASLASRALRAGSSTTTTLQVCRFDEVGAEEAAASTRSSVAAGTVLGRKPRTERCESMVSSTALQWAGVGRVGSR